MTETQSGAGRIPAPGSIARPPVTPVQAFHAAYAAKHPYADSMVPYDQLSDGLLGAIDAGVKAVIDNVLTEVRHFAETGWLIAAERERILVAAEGLKVTLSRPGNGPAHGREVDVVPFAALRDLLLTCGQCSSGLAGVAGCNCGGGGPGGIPPHEPPCGAEPCPNGCRDRPHPATTKGDGNG